MAAEQFESKTPDSEVCPAEHQELQDKIAEEWNRFSLKFLELLDSESSSGRLLFVFVRTRLRQFHLEKSYQEAFILNEVYIRAREKIQQGEVIRLPSAWIRQTAYNCIRELSREQRRSVEFQEDYLQEPTFKPLEPEGLTQDLAIMGKALDGLESLDRTLLELKVVEGLSWKEIRALLFKDGYGDYSEDALRKRKERALRNLRNIYHSLKPLS